MVNVGKKIDIEAGNYEPIWGTYFSEEGARIVRKIYQDCQETVDGRFHEVESFDQAGVTDLLQEVIDRGFTVHGLEIYQGWIEIYSREDIESAEREVAPVVG